MTSMNVSFLSLELHGKNDKLYAEILKWTQRNLNPDTPMNNSSKFENTGSSIFENKSIEVS